MSARGLLRASVVFGGVLLLCVLVTLIFGGANPWSGMDPGNASEQCEPLRDALWREPFNALSNFSYLAVGLLLWFRDTNLVRRALAVSFAFLFVGSGLFHGSMTQLFQVVDIIAIDVMLLVLVLYGAYAILGWRDRTLLGILLAVSAVLGVVMGLLKNEFILFDSSVSSGWLGAILFGLGVFAWFKRPASTSAKAANAIGAVVFFGLAALFKFTDGQGNAWCCPECTIQPHGLWHVFSGVGLLFIYQYYTAFSGEDAQVIRFG